MKLNIINNNKKYHILKIREFSKNIDDLRQINKFFQKFKRIYSFLQEILLPPIHYFK